MNIKIIYRTRSFLTLGVKVFPPSPAAPALCAGLIKVCCACQSIENQASKRIRSALGATRIALTEALPPNKLSNRPVCQGVTAQYVRECPDKVSVTPLMCSLGDSLDWNSLRMNSFSYSYSYNYSYSLLHLICNGHIRALVVGHV